MIPNLGKLCASGTWRLNGVGSRLIFLTVAAISVGACEPECARSISREEAVEFSRRFLLNRTIEKFERIGQNSDGKYNPFATTAGALQGLELTTEEFHRRVGNLVEVKNVPSRNLNCPVSHDAIDGRESIAFGGYEVYWNFARVEFSSDAIGRKRWIIQASVGLHVDRCGRTRLIGGGISRINGGPIACN